MKFAQYFFIYLALLLSTNSSLAQATQKILFVGNSLTYTNDLPRLVQKCAIRLDIDVATTTITKPNYALIDHWKEGHVQREISKEKYNYIIMQQGPSSQPYGRKSLIEYAKKLKKLCEKHGSKLAIFMVWPSRSYFHTFDGVIESHKLASEATDAILCPVGEKWKAHFDSTNNFDYYGSDGFHPSEKGSSKAAEIIVETLFSYEN